VDTIHASGDRTHDEGAKPVEMLQGGKAGPDVDDRAEGQTLTFIGTVLNAETMVPVPDAAISIASLDSNQASSALTAKDGNFQVNLVKALRYSVTAEARGFRKYVNEGLVVTSQFTPLRILMSPLHSLKVLVLSQSGGSVPDAAVDISGAGQDDQTRLALVHGRTDQKGVCVFEKIPKDEALWINVTHPLFLPAIGHQVSIPPDEEKTVRLQPVPETRMGIIVGRVTNRNGEPISAADVHVFEKTDPLVRSLATVVRARTDDSGNYGVARVRAGVFSMICSSPEYARDPRTYPVVVTAGQVSTQDFLLEDKGTVEGEVVDTDGQPVRRAMVELRLEQGAGTGALSGADGRFTIKEVPPGQHTVNVAHRDYVGLQRPLVCPVTDALRIVLERGLTIQGVASDYQGQPISSFEISLSRLDAPSRFGANKSQRFSNPEGAFEIRGMSAGHYRLLLRPEGGDEFAGEIDLADSVRIGLLIAPSTPDRSIRIMR